MKRLSDRAKFFLFGLLRTVSALATSSASRGAVVSSSSSLSSSPRPTETSLLAPLTLRLARRYDVPSLQRCNLATLPENYHSGFYVNHLRDWPDLAVVAVAPPRPGAWSSTSFPGHLEETVVAYVLGKVEERTLLVNDETSLLDEDENGVVRTRSHSPFSSSSSSSSSSRHYTTERLGHVTSLAVLEPYRRRGLAKELMEQLHYHLAVRYRVPAVGLHVRQSNTAADELYQRFGYRREESIPQYYQDGEDAYFMKKYLPESSWWSPPQQQQQQQQQQHATKQYHHHGFLGLGRGRPWEEGPAHLRLPRLVGVPPQQQSEPKQSSPNEETPEEVAELMTGTM